MLLLLSSFNPSVFLLHGSRHQSPSSSTVHLLGRMAEPPQHGRSVHSCGKLPWCCCHPRAAGCPKQSQTTPDRSTASLIRIEDLVIICWRRCYFLFHPFQIIPFTAAVLYSVWHSTTSGYYSISSNIQTTDTFVFYGYRGSLYLVQNCNSHPKLRNGYFHIPNYTALKYGSWRFCGFIAGCNRTLSLFHCIYEHTVVLRPSAYEPNL